MHILNILEWKPLAYALFNATQRVELFVIDEKRRKWKTIPPRTERENSEILNHSRVHTEHPDPKITDIKIFR